MASNSNSSSASASMTKNANSAAAPAGLGGAGAAPPVEKPIMANWIDYDGTTVTQDKGELHTVLDKPQPDGVSRIILIDSHDEKDLDKKGKPKELHDHYAHCATCKRQLKAKWYWPEYLFSDACWKSNGYVREFVIAGTGADARKAKFFRCLVKHIFDRKPRFKPKLHPNEEPIEELGLDVDYRWHEMTITIIPRADKSVSVICYGVRGDPPPPATLATPSIPAAPTGPEPFHTTFAKALTNMTSEMPSAPESERVWVALLHEIVQCYDDAIWAVAKATRKVEKSRGINRNFEMLHELLRHGIHLTEVLEVGVDSLRILSGTKAGSTRSTIDDDQFWYRMLENFIRRSKANETRLHNEIQLALNLVTQDDSKATIELSKSAQADSRAVLAITIITMVFLPATFVATLFGMSFFNYEAGQGWSVTGEIWIFWLVSAVLTIVTLLIYAYWLHRMQPIRERLAESKTRRQEREKKREEEREEKRRQGRTPTMQLVGGN